VYQFIDSCKLPSEVTNWSVTGALSLLTSTPYSVTVEKNSDGEAIIIATFQNGQTITKTIQVGVPVFQYFASNYNSNQSLCIAPINCLSTGLESNEVTAVFSGQTIVEANTNTNWQWMRSNNLIWLNNHRGNVSICPLYAGGSSFMVRARNACG
jgi:hypothetical protein